MATVEDKRRQLQRLYCELVASDGATIVHQMLSRALVENRGKHKAKKPRAPKRQPKPPPPRGPTTITWRSKTLQLGEAMRRLNHRQQQFVLAVVHDGMGTREAEKMACYSAGGGPKASPYVREAMAEEKRRVI